MIPQQKFLEIINQPYRLDKQTHAFLQKLAQDYPYCQSIQILLAKNLQDGNKLEFEKQVNKASAYSVDRRKFQRYLSDRDKALYPADAITQESSSAPEIPTQAEDTNRLAEHIPEPAPVVVPEIQVATTVIETPASSPQPSEERTRSLLDIVKKRLKEIQQEMKGGAKSPDQASPSKPVWDTPQVSEIITEKPPGKTEEPLVAKPELHNPETQQSSTPASQIPAEADLLPRIRHNKPLRSKKPDLNQLIDKFLKEEPRIKASKDLPEEQEDLSEKSSEAETHIVSETLALVYIKQGNKDKALDIYEKLCLKFPEKSSYFAQKIIAIKNEIN